MLQTVGDSWSLIAGKLPAFAIPCVRTVVLSGLAVGLSIVCGLVAVLARRSTFWLIRQPAECYVWFIRGTPALIQVYIVYFSLPAVGIVLSPEVAGVTALGVSSGAYMSEVFRSGLSAIPKGQYESTTAIGMSPAQAFRRIVFPQVFRIVLPAMTNETISTLKSSSLLAMITVYEITLYTKIVVAETFAPFEFYFVSTIIYLLLAHLIAWVSSMAERRYSWSV